MDVFTIGFTQRSARSFFESLKSSGIKKLVDVRIGTTSQLAGFAKAEDLAYFLDAICGIEYLHEPLLAPTLELRDSFRGKRIGWSEFEAGFLSLMRERRIETALDRSLFEGPAVLLCSEAGPEHCHRRLILHYLQEKWGGIQARHL